MAAGMALTVAQTLFAALQCAELRELSSMLGYESRLRDLKRTVTMIKAILLDADSKNQELTNEGRDWVEKLKDAIYDADDLFDKLATKAQQLKSKPEGKFYKKVRRFFSNDNQILFGFNNSREIKKLREKLDAIANDRMKFGVGCEYKPIKRREETCSYVYETNIIGRDAEKERVVDMLLSDLNSVSFVSVVGMGGLGKTALAQLVFNDKRIKDTFGEDMYWVCVSEEFGLKEILSKLCDVKNDYILERLQIEVRKKIEGKRYLLVLDDVWEENHYEWLKLKEFLCSGGARSRILVTTRSRAVAEAVDKDLMFELGGLSEENSWNLFRRIAFREGDDHDTRLVEIGKDVVKKCANVPLSIKVTSSLLHGRDKSKWEAFKNVDLPKMNYHSENDPIMSTLMFSYYNLTPDLKSCFSCCSLFPKDYVIKKDVLISLWLANGYLVPRHESEIMEDVGEEYFWILLQRCFFQDVQQDEYGEIHSCKIHDLMHDLALEVAGKESLILTTSSIDDLEKRLRHLSTTRNAPIDFLSSKDCLARQTLRTLTKLDWYSSLNVNVGTLVNNCRSLRVLQLRGSNMSSLPEELELPKDIGNLVNLRMLDIHGCTQLEEIPKDIGKLVNLTMLDMHRCFQLKELPEAIVELVDLRILNISSKSEDCKINYMPAGVDKLKNLRTLTYFVVGGDSSMPVQKGELTDLKAFKFLKGYLCIKVRSFLKNNMLISTKGASILSNARLKGLQILCEWDAFDLGEYHERLLEGLYPNNELETLVMSKYQGINFPYWGLGKVTFPAGIVRLELISCVGLKHLSSLSKLVCLKYLHLSNMENLEYIESDPPSNVSETFFPSLEELNLTNASKLKGWWRDIRWEKDGGCNVYLVDTNGCCVEVLPSLARIHDLRISGCESLKYIPPCPHLKELYLARVNRKINFCMKSSSYFQPSKVKDTNPSTSSSSDLCSNHPTLFCLDKLKIYDSDVFNSLFGESFLGSVNIDISLVNDIREIREGFQKCASSVRHLLIGFFGCQILSGGGLEYLTNLESLKIQGCHNLHSLNIESYQNLQSLIIESCHKLQILQIESCQNLQSLKIVKSDSLNLEEDIEGMLWKSLQSLSTLELIKLPKVVNLPKNIRYLSSLQSLLIEECHNLEALGELVGSLTSLKSLHIKKCPELKSLPEAICHLTSLTRLHIFLASDELKKRCREPNGEDCSKIRHIPNLRISRNEF